MNSEQSNKDYSKLEKLLLFSCPDIDCPIEGDSPELHCCQYCLHIPEDTIKNGAQNWVCELPNREAQRRHFASMNEKQKVLL